MAKNNNRAKHSTAHKGNSNRKHHHNYRRNYANNNPGNEQEGNNSQQSSPSKLQQKATSAALSAVGVPKGVSDKLASNEKFYDLVEKGKFFIMLPAPVKIVIVGLVLLIPLIPLLVFVVILSDDGAGGMGGATFEYGKTCTKITVENTGCDENGENCTHEHDGEVEFEDYIAGVVAAEADGSNNLEYYKLLATITRTYLHENAPDDCIVDGNDSFKPYVDINTSTNAELIKQAVTETKNKIVIKDDKLTNVEYCEACVVNADDNNYYIRYGSESLAEAKLQPIPKSWDSESHPYTGKLSTLYSQVDQSVPDYNDRDCPNNDDSGMSEIGAYYLTSQGGYTYEGVIKYYYGPEVEIVENSMQLSGVDGFLNPTGKIYCSSPYGPRTHPVKGGASNHSGIDIAIPGGEPIYAANDGIITYVQKGVTGVNDCDYGYGNYIIIDHGDGMSTLYAHIQYDSIPDSIETGAMVRQGEQIGQIGSTGCSTGNHLHYEVRQNNKTVDPADYLDLTKASGICRR